MLVLATNFGYLAALLVFTFTVIMTPSRGWAGKADVDISRVPSAPLAPLAFAEFATSGLNRRYALYSPPRTAQTGRRPLVVMLHGCLQDAETFATVAGMNELALRENFYVLYPEQDETENSAKCWNWSEATNLTQDGTGSERAFLKALIEEVVTQLPIDPKRVYVGGFAAGAAMAVNLISCYPDMFAGAALSAAPPFASLEGDNENSELTPLMIANTLSPLATARRALECAINQENLPHEIFIIDGNSKKNESTESLLTYFETLSDLRDDGDLNASVQFKKQKTKKVGASKSSRRKRGTRSQGRNKTLGYTVTDFNSERLGTKMRVIHVQKMGQAWSGGAVGIDFSAPNGPNSANLIWDFFANP